MSIKHGFVARAFTVLVFTLLLASPPGLSGARRAPLDRDGSSGPLVGAGTPLPILAGATWAYFKGTVEPAAAWNTIAFNDASWLTGPSGFGYGDNDDATVLSDMQNGYLSVYTRRQFDVPNPDAIAGLQLTVNWDDGFVAFINGQEVARRNLAGTAGTPVAHDIAASSHEAGTAETIAVSSSMLVAGTNVIAVQGHNRALDSSDLSLVVELRATNPPPGAPTGPAPANGATGVPINPNLCVTVSDPNDASLNVSFYGRPASVTPAAPFTIIALPDTQFYSESFPATYSAQTQWLVDNLGPRNIAFVTQLGDCVNVAATIQQWVNADTAWDIAENPLTTGLQYGIPYGIAVGNHDQTPTGDPGTFAAEGSTTVNFNNYFGVTRYTGRSYYGNHYGANNDNHYELFSTGGMDFIAIHMEYMPADSPLRQAVLAWADGVLNAFPSRRAMLTAHYFLNPSDASFSDQGAATWAALRHHHNLFLMLSGHLDQANNRYEEFTDGTGTTKLHALVSDYQTRPNGGDGWLRIMTFHPDTDTINVETYSPTLGVFIDNHVDNTAGTAKNRLTLTYDMPGGAPFALVGQTPATSGSQACVPWPGRAGNTAYEWYAVVTDGVSTTTGSTSTFTTGPATCSSSAQCNDSNPCTQDACVSNLCQNTPIAGCCVTSADCNDSNACTNDSCNSGTCQHANNTASCDDGNGCTVGDVCAAGVCAGVPNSCNDGNACTSDSCVAGACVNAYNPSPGCCVDSDDCDDGLLCSADSCQAGSCVNVANANCCDTNAQCDDGEVCTADTCSPTNTASLVFNGSSSYVTMGIAPALGTPQFTIETWFNRTGTGVSNTTGTNGIANLVPLVAKGAPESDASNVDANFILGINTDGNVLAADFEQFGTCTGGTGNCTTAPFGPGCNCTTNANCQSNVCANAGLNHPASGTTVIVNNTWYHAAATYDGSTWRLYLNGDLEATLPVGAVNPRSDSIQPFDLGTMQKSAGASTPLQLGFFAGMLDEVRVWNTARPQSEIQATMHAQVLSATGLIGRWGLNEGSGPSTADSTAPAENGALNGSAAWGAGVPEISSGTCTHDPVANCCHNNAECNDGNPCTNDACEGAQCENVATPGCCNTAADCNDGNPCTNDVCSGNVCSNPPNPNCCSTDAQCNDSNTCTNDVCPASDPDMGSGGQAALTFDGVDDYVTMGVAPGLGAAQFTVETWFRRTGAGDSNTTGTNGIPELVPLVAKGAPEAEGSNVDANFILGINTAGNVLAADFEQFGTCTGGTGNCTTAPFGPGCNCSTNANCQSNVCANAGLNHPISGTNAIADNTWYHAAATYDGTTWRLYLNGNLEATLAVGAVNPRSDSIQPMGLGTMQKSAGGASPLQVGFFAGQLDEVRVWNLARTQAQIQAGMHREILSATGLTGRWGLNEGSGTLAHDATGGENGTLTSGPAWALQPADPLGFGTPSICQHNVVVGGGCCATTADCNDGLPCTQDACTNNACTFTPIPGCTPCTADAQCDDTSTCTSDRCNTANDASVDLTAASGDYVDLGQSATANNFINNYGTGGFTVESWFYARSVGTDLTGIFRAGQQGTAPQVVIQLRTGTSPWIATSVERSAGGAGTAQLDAPSAFAASAAVTLNAWHHVALVMDRATPQLRTYLDGALVGTSTPAWNAADPVDMIAGQTTLLGVARSSTPALVNSLDGYVDEVRIWSRALSASEILASMNREVVSGTNLEHRWGFNEPSGLAIDDPGTFDGTLVSSARTTSVLPALGNDLCEHAAANEGLVCTDGNNCTINDACASGSCVGTTITAPAESQGVLATNKTIYTWSATPGATRYDVLRGAVSALPVGPGGADEVCFNDLPAATVTDTTTPTAGAGFWYLSRGKNACGSGTYGTRKNGTPRTSTTCP